MLNLILPLLLCSRGIPLDKLDKTREELRPFLNAIATVESNNNDDAVGDSGKAIGRYQIWRSYWQDAVSYSPTLKGEYKNVKDKVYAERVLVAYLLRYVPNAVADKDYEKMARTHNGGPKGASKGATGGYWKRVKKVLAETVRFKRPKVCYRNSEVQNSALNEI